MSFHTFKQVSELLLSELSRYHCSIEGDLGIVPCRQGPFWETTDKLLLSFPPPFKDTKEDENHQYLTLFDDNSEGEGVLITSHSILRMM